MHHQFGLFQQHFLCLLLCGFFQTFRREMFRQLQNVALNVALGVVSERPYVKRVQNPYAHFGRPDLWTEGFRRNNQRFIHNHIYRICEVRPPSIEKVKYSEIVCVSVCHLVMAQFIIS